VPAAGGFNHDLGDALAFTLGELVGLAEHAENGHAVDARAAREFRQPPQARLVQAAVGVERRRRDVVNAGQIVEHQNLNT
jgi:hypothetical protein